MADVRNTERLPPPSFGASSQVAGGALNDSNRMNPQERGIEPNQDATLTKKADPQSFGPVYATRPHLGMPTGVVNAQCRFLGTFAQEGLRVFVREYSIVGALELTLNVLHDAHVGPIVPPLESAAAHAGGGASRGRLCDWLDTGD